MVVAGIILGLILLFIAFYVLSVDKTLNIIWEFLRKRIYFNYINTKQALIERLSQFHHKSELEIEFDTSEYKASIPFHFWHSLRYLLKLSLIFISVSIFFALASSYFFENIYDYMYYKPRFIYTIIQRRVALTEMLFFTYENELQDTNKSLTTMFPQFGLFTDPVQLYTNAVNSLILTKNIMRDPNTMKLMSTALMNDIFWSLANSSDFQTLGTQAAMNFLELESHFIIFNDETDSPDVIAKYAEETIAQSDVLATLYVVAENDAQNKINAELQAFIDFIICFCIFLISMYVFYYRTYFNAEKKVLTNVMKLIAMLPPNQLGYSTNATSLRPK